MKNVKYAKCVRCGKIYEAVPNLTNCVCGGILDIIYDYEYIKSVLTKDKLQRNTSHNGAGQKRESPPGLSCQTDYQYCQSWMCKHTTSHKWRPSKLFVSYHLYFDRSVNVATRLKSTSSNSSSVAPMPWVSSRLSGMP